MNALFEAASRYAAAGWRVFPLHTLEISTGKCSCGGDSRGRPCGKDAAKHPRIKKWQEAASTDPAQIERWWGPGGRWPDANIGIATGATMPSRPAGGAGLVVVDVDGHRDIATLKSLTDQHGPLPVTATVRTRRGWHLYFTGELAGSKTVAGLLVRGQGGYVVAPPSRHASGVLYAWDKTVSLAELPEWFRTWLQTAGGSRLTASGSPTLLSGLGGLPDHLVARKQEVGESLAGRALKALGTDWSAAEEARIRSALGAIPASCGRDQWLQVGMALHALGWGGFASGGGSGAETGGFDDDRGFALWAEWSRTGGEKYQGDHDLETRWRSFRRSGVTIGTLFHMAREAGWVDASVLPPGGVPRHEVGAGEPEPRAAEESPGEILNGHAAPPGSGLAAGAFATKDPENPLIRLNEKYAVIGDVGGKCLVMGWVSGKVDALIPVPSFQSFKSFSERYANQYVIVKGSDSKGNPTEEAKQIGTYWLKWSRRRSYEGIDLVPGAPDLLPNGYLNLWRGFSVSAVAGLGPDGAPARWAGWRRMQHHIVDVLASGDVASADYIVRFAAWAVQHPGERAEVALVFRGGKGSGKGSFANLLVRLFGVHGLQIFSSKHLVGAFNGHLRNCILLFADEAFWAGDRQGESTLKGMLTERALMIEQKGVDAVAWKNRLHVIMAANADWVVPASHDERRFAMFDVSAKQIGNLEYFKALHDEMQAGGLSAMLHDLLAYDLGTWHPRQVPQTEALRAQKERSLDPRYEWWESVLQAGQWPAAPDTQGRISASVLIDIARAQSPKLRDISVTAFGRFLREQGGAGLHTKNGNCWKLPELVKGREAWERKFGKWPWRNEAEMWS